MPFPLTPWLLSIWTPKHFVHGNGPTLTLSLTVTGISRICHGNHCQHNRSREASWGMREEVNPNPNLAPTVKRRHRGHEGIDHFHEGIDHFMVTPPHYMTAIKSYLIVMVMVMVIVIVNITFTLHFTLHPQQFSPSYRQNDISVYPLCTPCAFWHLSIPPRPQ